MACLSLPGGAASFYCRLALGPAGPNTRHPDTLTKQAAARNDRGLNPCMAHVPFPWGPEQRRQRHLRPADRQGWAVDRGLKIETETARK